MPTFKIEGYTIPQTKYHTHTYSHTPYKETNHHDYEPVQTNESET